MPWVCGRIAANSSGSSLGASLSRPSFPYPLGLHTAAVTKRGGLCTSRRSRSHESIGNIRDI
ncbi:hypothetical protein FKM82_018111 [Ascaphus truei]